MADLGESGAPFMLKGKRIWVAGHRGMVGAATVRRLGNEDCEILTAGREVVYLRKQTKPEDWIAEARLDGDSGGVSGDLTTTPLSSSLANSGWKSS